MKRKFFSTLVALVLLLTLGLVSAVPTGAIPTPAAVSFDIWDGGGGSDNWSYTPAGFSGSYCLELSGPMIVKVAYGETFADLAVVAAAQVDSMDVWDIMWTIHDTATTGDKLHAKIYLNTTLDGAVDTVLTGGFGAFDATRENEVWLEAWMRSDSTWQIDGYDDGDFTDAATVGLVTYDAGDDDYRWDQLMGHDDAWAAATVVYIAYGYGGTDGSGFVDDITVAGIVYEVEPPLPPLDDDDYKVDDVATVTVYDINANTNAAVRETILVTAAGSVPVHSISLGLLETGVDTGIFTETFTLVGTTPGTGELLVSHGSVITVTYDTDLVVTADVDNVAPVITIVSPTNSSNITDVTPEIKATYTDAASGTDNTTAVMKLDGSIVAATATGSQITYTPSANLTDGSYAVTVNIKDKVGNAATQKSWSFTVDNVDPVITGQVATPSIVSPNVSSNITFTATVADATSGVDTVTINVSSIDSATALAMTDDGGGTYSVNVTTSVTITDATYLLLVTATDFATNSDSANITLIVSSDTTAPVISSPAITYLYGLSSARPGGTVTISANVTEAVGMGTVTAACTALVGTPVSLTQGVGDAWSVTATVATGTSGNYTVTIAAVDAKGNVATPDASLTLTVDPAATGYDIALEEGWNLISLPLIPDSSDITVVISNETLASGNVTSVGIIRGYDPATGLFPSYTPSTGSGGLTEMVDGRGYWVFMETSDNLTITGRQWPTPPAVPPTYDVVVGWNLIGFKSIENDLDTNYLANIVGTYPVLWSYDATAGAYENVKGVTPAEDCMKVGHGFWIWITEAGTIVPPQ